jgi:hypothetical protein
VERLAGRLAKPKTERATVQQDANVKAAIEELQRVYGTRVFVHPGVAGHPGRIIFEYYNDSDLNRLYDQFVSK